MPSLTVPERLRTGIIRIGEMPSSSFDQLLDALSRAPECKDRKQLSAWIGNETSELKASTRDEILVALTSMFRVRTGAGVGTKEFASDVWESLAESIPDRTSTIDGPQLQSRIAALLDQGALDTAAGRVGEVKRDVERNFCKVRAATDLRPAFRSDSAGIPTEMAVIHNFQIIYHDSMGKHKAFYVSLDGGDLQALKSAVSEAEKRAETLEKMLSSANINLHK